MLKLYFFSFLTGIRAICVVVVGGYTLFFLSLLSYMSVQSDHVDKRAGVHKHGQKCRLNTKIFIAAVILSGLSVNCMNNTGFTVSE